MKYTIPTLVLCFGTAVLASAAPHDDESEEHSHSSAVSQTDSDSQVRSGTEISQQQLKVSDAELKKTVTDANKATKFIGMKVKNRQDEDLGTIKDLVLDLEAGKIAYAVLSHGSVLGMGGKYVAVPIQALTLQPGAKALLLDLPKQQLAQAPGFEDKHWPDLDAAAKGQTIGLAASTPSQDTAQGASEAEVHTITTSGSSSWRTNSSNRGTSASLIDTNTTDTTTQLKDDSEDSDSTTESEDDSDSDDDSHDDDSSNSSDSNSSDK